MAAVMLAAALLFTAPATSFAVDGDYREPSAESIVFDVLLVRPLGVAATAVGTVIFVAGLPFTVPTMSVGTAAKKLVAEPFVFTFGRPVGDRAD